MAPNFSTPVLVVIAGNCLVFASKMITSTDLYDASAPVVVKNKSSFDRRGQTSAASGQAKRMIFKMSRHSLSLRLWETSLLLSALATVSMSLELRAFP